MDLEAKLWSKLKWLKVITREPFSFEVKVWQNLDLEAKLWGELKRPKIIARELISFEIKVWACLAARIRI